jgi:hypothetical protein
MKPGATKIHKIYKNVKRSYYKIMGDFRTPRSSEKVPRSPEKSRDRNKINENKINKNTKQ